MRRFPLRVIKNDVIFVSSSSEVAEYYIVEMRTGGVS
jgi:hypothetical protein